MPQSPNDFMSTLVQVMAQCRQATIHYLSHRWPWSMSPYVVTRPQWVSKGSPQRTLWSFSSRIQGLENVCSHIVLTDSHNYHHLPNHERHWLIEIYRWVQVSHPKYHTYNLRLEAPCLIEASHKKMPEFSLLPLTETLLGAHLIRCHYCLHRFCI